jgi:tRNA pseudouridine13 synthase
VTLLVSWREVALQPPTAFGTPPAQALVRAQPEDFRVDEELRFVADGGVAHVLLRIEKRAMTTLAAATQLARSAGCAARDVGFAGMKDRNAVTSQWFTVPAQARPASAWNGVDLGAQLRVLEALPHSRKLRRGALAGNRFRLVLREVKGDRMAIEARLEQLRVTGAPNYFGPQRFGRGGSNLVDLVGWQAGAATPERREPRAFLLSAARALVFNAVLGERVRQNTWASLLPGEVVSLQGSRSVFVAGEIDAALVERCRAGDVHPSGPLIGCGDSAAGGEAQALEQRVTAGYAGLLARLCATRVEAARRALRLLPQELRWQWQDVALVLEFRLVAGGFATALLRELLRDPGSLPEGDGDA